MYLRSSLSVDVFVLFQRPVSHKSQKSPEDRLDTFEEIESRQVRDFYWKEADSERPGDGA